MNRIIRIGAISLLLAAATTAHAGVGVTVKGGTLGVGVEVTKSLVPRVNARANGNFFKYSFDLNRSDVNYSADLKLRSFALLLDLHPAPGLGFRLSGGLFVNKNRVGMVSTPQGTYQIGNVTYTGAQIGTLNGGFDFRSVSPYVGLGWGNAAGRRVGVAFNLGVVLQGVPRLSLTATGPISTDATFRNNLDQEVQSVQDKLNLFKYYPEVSLGITFKVQ